MKKYIIGKREIFCGIETGRIVYYSDYLTWRGYTMTWFGSGTKDMDRMVNRTERM